MEKYMNNKGLSLVEVIMAALLVAVMVSGLFAVVISANNMTMLSKHKLGALTWAQSELEKERARIRGSLAAGNDPTIPNMLQTDKTSGGGASAVPTITPYAAGMYRLSVNVTWTE